MRDVLVWSADWNIARVNAAQCPSGFVQITLGETKVVNDRSKVAGGYLQSSKCDWQPETPWPGASGIYIEHTVNRLDERSMRVAGNDHVNSASCWIDLQFLKVVQDIEGPLPELDLLSVGIVFRPLASIDVSFNGNDGRYPTEFDENVRATNIAGVNDMRHPGKLLLGLGPQKPMGVRDDSNPQHCGVSLRWGRTG